MRVCTTCATSYPDTERFCPRDGTPLRSTDANADLVGTVIADRYEVLRKLGEGGMGQVYLAEHVRLKRKSAVKIVHPRLAQDADALSRFNREASNACQIQHPNVAAIYDFGETADGIVYIAMEYVEGEPLSHLLAASAALPPARGADITRQVADGLDVAHRLGIVHRDLKPDNILIGAHHDGRDWVRVVDFGISKAVGQQGQTVTHTGQVVGTPDFMSPEQLSGELIDFRSDVYSLAIVAFNMLTGELPFLGDGGQSSMLLRLSERPRRLASTAMPIAWTDEIQFVFDRAMAFRAEERYASASAFALALSDAVARLSPAADVAAKVRSAAAAVPPSGLSPSSLSPSSLSPSTAGPAGGRGTTPANLSFPVPSGLSPSELAAVEAHLARSVGPIAKVLVRRAALSSPSKEALLTALCAEIDDAAERARFRRSVG